MKEIIKKAIKQQGGATLVMSLLILSLTIASATALSRIILGEVRMTINTTNSLKAFYAADSAIEKALYYIKYSRETGDQAPFQSLDDKNFTVDNMDFTFVQASTTVPSYISYNISTSTSAHVDIIDPAGDLPIPIDWDLNGDNPHYYQLTWTIDNCFPNHASDKLEITSYSFNSSPFNVTIDKDIVVCDCAYPSNTCDTSLTQKNISDNTFYRFSFKPLDNTVASILFEVFRDETGIGGLIVPVDTTANFLVIADGTYKNNGYRLKAEVPALAAISNIFSYVIFSEESLSKGF